MLTSSTDSQHRHSLNGPTMGSRWTAVVYALPGFDTDALTRSLAAAAGQVNDQMTTWDPDSDLMRLNAAPLHTWVTLPPQIMQVLDAALRIGTASGGLFDIGVGDLVHAWGFGPAQGQIDPDGIKARLGKPVPSAAALHLDPVHNRARKGAAMTLDLSGIAKGYGVDQLADTCRDYGLTDWLVGIDGEMRASGSKAGQGPWTIAIEAPATGQRAAGGIIELTDQAVATSGDYRHFIRVGPTIISHTMNPLTGGPVSSPVTGALTSVSVLADTCMLADAWATVLMAIGAEGAAELARAHHLHAILMIRDGADLRQVVIGDNG